MDISLLLYRLSGWSQDLIWLIVCWLAIRKYWYWQKHYRYFLIYIIAMTVLELIYAISAILLTNNLFLDYIYITIEFIVVSFFLKGIIKIQWLDIFIVISSIIFLIFQVLNAFWLQGFENYNSYGTTVNCLYLFVLATWAYTLLNQKKIPNNIFSQPETWFVLSIALINLSVLLFDLLYALAVPYKNDSLLYTILILQNCIKSIYICLFIKGILKIKNPSSQLS
jgi:hypothetical protein